MAWNNGFPATYQPMYYQQPQPMYQQPAQNNSRVVEVIPVDNEESAVGWPVGVGETKELMSKNDAFVCFKSVSMNGQTEITFYDKRPPKPPEPVFNPTEYVRKDELRALITETMKGEIDNEPLRKAWSESKTKSSADAV